MLGPTTGLWAKGKNVAVQGSAVEEGDDAVETSRFAADPDDTYTDDSESLDVLGGSKFKDEAGDEDRETDDSD
jgi:hypothetical protein